VLRNRKPSYSRGNVGGVLRHPGKYLHVKIDMFGRRSIIAAVLLTTVPPVTTPTAQGQDLVRSSTPETSETVVVTATSPQAPSKSDLSNDPLASPSSVTVVPGSEIQQQTIESYGDIFRPVAGVSVNNFGQGNLSYGITLRGFDEGNHGGDLAYSIDGVPTNIPSSLVGINGYSDLQSLIPELIRDVAIYRGPFNERYGDFALGGAVDIRTVDHSPSFLELTGGSFDTLRGLGVYGFNFGPVGGYTAFEADTSSGYRDNNAEKTIESFSRFETPILGGQGTVGFISRIYSTDYGAPGYINRTLVENGTISPTTAENPNDGGSLTELSFSTPIYVPSPHGDFFATFYINRDLDKRWSDFNTTPDSDDAPDRLQIDDRWTAGTTIEKTFSFDEYGNALHLPTEIIVGVQSRADFVTQFQSTAIHRSPVGLPSLEADFDQETAAGYVRLELQPFPWLKIEGGTRYDRFFYDVDVDSSGQLIDHNTGAFSPKTGVGITPVRGVSIFSDYGESLRSPDATQDLTGNPDLQPAKLRSVEAGVTYDTPQPTPPAAAQADAKDKGSAALTSTTTTPALPGPATGTVHVLADVYYTTLSNEVITGPDGITPENLGLSRRRGVELETSYEAYHSENVGLSLFANYYYIDAILLNGPEHQFVPDVSRFHLNYGFDVSAPLFFNPGSPHRLGFEVYHEIIGPKHLTSDGLEYTKTYTRLSAKVTYANTKLPGFKAFVGIVAYPTRRLDEAAFDLGGGVVGVSPVPLVSLQGGLAYVF
jgi:outer membrane receptor protein involved in Fe transport